MIYILMAGICAAAAVVQARIGFIELKSQRLSGPEDYYPARYFSKAGIFGVAAVVIFLLYVH